MVFPSSYQLFSARVVGLFLSIRIPKMIINYGKDVQVKIVQTMKDNKG